MTRLDEPLTLPSGLTLPNRIAKAPMTENLADADNQPTDAPRAALPPLGRGRQRAAGHRQPDGRPAPPRAQPQHRGRPAPRRTPAWPRCARPPPATPAGRPAQPPRPADQPLPVAAAGGAQRRQGGLDAGAVRQAPGAARRRDRAARGAVRRLGAARWSRPASTACRCTPPTATCWRSSSRPHLNRRDRRVGRRRRRPRPRAARRAVRAGQAGDRQRLLGRRSSSTPPTSATAASPRTTPSRSCGCSSTRAST